MSSRAPTRSPPPTDGSTSTSQPPTSSTATLMCRRLRHRRLPATAARGVPLSSFSRSGSSEGPGWWARVCCCLALVIGCVPIRLVTPNDHEYLPHPGVLLTLVCIALGLLQLLLGATGSVLGQLACWNMLQHHPGWTYAFAGFYSFVSGVVIAVVTMMTWLPYMSWVADAITVGAHILLLIGGLGLLHVVQWAIDRRTRLPSSGSPKQGQSAQIWPSDYPGRPGRSIR